MSTTDDGLSRALTVAILVMVLASTPAAALGHGGTPSSVATPGGDDDFTFAATDYIGCIEFNGDGETQCGGTLSNTVEVEPHVIPTTVPGLLKLRVDASIESGFSGQYKVEARADGGGWSSATIGENGVSLAVRNTHRRGSVQYPTVYVRVVDATTGTVVAYNSMIYNSPVTIATGDTSWFDSDIPALDNNDYTDPLKGATVVGDDTREVRQPTYATVSRFNDNDGRHEDFEDKSLPPVRYDEAGAKVAGPNGDILYFDNLREQSGFPAIFRHGNDRMRLGTALFGIPSAEYQKMRIDYGLQTETSSQTVQVNLVDSYGEQIDPSMQNAPSRRLTQTTGQSASYFTNRQQYENALYEDNLNTNSIEFSLTDREREYIAENNDVYVTYKTDNRAYLLLYRTPIISQSVQNQQKENFVPDMKYFEEDFNANQGSENVATFDATYEIEGELNDKHDSFDRKPGEDVSLQVTVRNKGDERVERRIGIYSMSQKNVSLYGAGNAEAKVIDKRVVGVEPRSTKTFSVKYDYADHEFGYHNVSVLDTTNANNPTPIARERDSTNVSQVYVLQPATFKVRNVITPNSWLIHDNFNTTVVVQNVGDLNGTGTLTGEFQEWTGEKQIPDTRGGNVREGANGSYANITFDRNGFEYSPSYPQRPEEGNPENRPNAPYGTKLTYSDNLAYSLDQTPPDNESVFDATTSHDFAKPNDKLYESLNHTKEGEGVRIYALDIVTLKVENERSNSDTWYASGWGYYNQTGATEWTAWEDTSPYDIFENPANGMPTIIRSQVIYPPYQVGDSSNTMTVHVKVRNNGQTEVGDARVKVLTDKTGLDGAQGGIVGTSGEENLPAWDETTLNVPVVIRNDEGNGGTHTLSAWTRTNPDYIQRIHVRQSQDSGSLNDQFQTQVDIQLWADFVHKATEQPTQTINEQCLPGDSSDTNPTDQDGDMVTCDGTNETYVFNQFHKNYGGVAGDLTVDAFIGTERDPSGHSHYSDFGLVSDPLGSDSTNYWNAQTQTVQPNENKTFTARGIPINEPGVYVVKSEPHRVNYEGNLAKYNDTGYVLEEEWIKFKVLDITKPEPYAEITDTTYSCKSGTCDGDSSGTWSVHEGATVEFDNDSVDNVVANWINWEGSPSYNGGERRCHGADHCYSSAGFADNPQGDKIVHRVDGSDETITLRVRDHPAYGQGAPLNGVGTPNEATEDWTLNVVSDNNTPSVNIKDDYHNNADNSPDSNTVWESYSSTGYDGIEVCFATSASDTEIGIEADDWSGTSLPGSANEDTRCRTWSSTGDKTAIYKAWDFAGNLGEDSATVNVQHDNSDPTNVGLNGDRSNRWVDKAYHSSSVSWSGSGSDDETGLINCDDGGPYDWSGDTNGEASYCSDSFSTEYSSASESGTTFEVTLEVTDYHGNSETVSDSVVQYEDKSDPTVSGESKSCSTGYSDENGCSVTACVDYSDNGPFGGIGIHHTSGAGGDGCVTASANANANANADASTPSSCGQTNYDYDYDTATDSDYESATVTVYDEHGNSASAFISASASDKDDDFDSDSASSDPCPPPPDDGGSGSGGYIVSAPGSTSEGPDAVLMAITSDSPDTDAREGELADFAQSVPVQASDAEKKSAV